MKIVRLHHLAENNSGALIFGILFIAMLGGMAQIVPLLFNAEFSRPAAGVKPYTPLQLAGREVYLRESCALCHTQQVRPLLAEVLRYGPYSDSDEFVYDRPFLWGSKRTGPDLHRIGGKYSDVWHRIHLVNPRQVVPGSIMPAYPWLLNRSVDVASIQSIMQGLQQLGQDYTDEAIAESSKALQDKSEMDALIAYLQSLGVAR